MPIWAIFAIAAVLAPLVGFVRIWILAAFVNFSGLLIGGEGKRPETFRAVAWSQVPIVAVLPLWGVTHIVLREEMFTTEMPRFDEQMVPFVVGVVALTTWLFSEIWSFVLLVRSSAEVQGFGS